MPLIGARLREMRQSRGLTLRQVAEASGISLSFLSLVERDKVSISVDNLERLTRFYGVRMAVFFQGAEESPVLVTRRSQIKARMNSITPGKSVLTWLTDRADARMEPILIKIGSGYRDPQVRTHEGDSFLYVMEGQIRLVSENGEPIILEVGEAAYYSGCPGRRIENVSPIDPALVLLVTAPPAGVTL